MPEGIKIILVDTNCFIRLFHSSVHPIFGQDVGGYLLLTLDCLVKEYLTSERLVDQFPWIAKEPRLSELQKASLKLRAASINSVRNHTNNLKPYSRLVLEKHCNNKKIEIKSLSRADLELLATSSAIHCIIATDEWPLRLVAADLLEDDPDQEYIKGMFNSIELLHLLEQKGVIDADQRRGTVDAWIRSGEKLLRGWRDDYQRLFNEEADELGL